VKVAIINYGMGNLASVYRALEDEGAEAYIADTPAALSAAERIILPGVGAFADGMAALTSGGWVEALDSAATRSDKPLLGICLGMQMLASRSHEGQLTDGLGFIPGEVQRLDALGCELRIPHVGWNEVRYRRDDCLLDGIPEGSDFYFVHSFAMVPDDHSDLVATSAYGCEVTAVVRRENVFGCQFHPEKSSKAGRRLLRNFLRYTPC
jgi:imidazole glycerol-phosphate synthase subunit HisH